MAYNEIFGDRILGTGTKSGNLDTIEEMNEKLPGIRDIILTDPLEKARESSEPIKKFS